MHNSSYLICIQLSTKGLSNIFYPEVYRDYDREVSNCGLNFIPLVPRTQDFGWERAQSTNVIYIA